MAITPALEKLTFPLCFEEGFFEPIPVMKFTEIDRFRFEKMKSVFEKNVVPPNLLAEQRTALYEVPSLKDGLIAPTFSVKGFPIGLRRIPAIAHQIWIGPKPVPQYLYRNREIFLQLHPDFECHLWHEEELRKRCLPDQDLVDMAENWGQKADIYKANILELFGGVILDADVRVIKPLYSLVERFDFFAGAEKIRDFIATADHLFVGVSIIGACSHHPTITLWRERMRASSKIVLHPYADVRSKVMHATYYPFTDAITQTLGQSGLRDVIFPPVAFYPPIPPPAESFSIHDSAEAWLK